MKGADLSAELRRRAEETADAIMNAAQAEAYRIAADANRAIEARRSEVLKRREAEYRTEARGRMAGEQHEAMRAILLAKTRVVERVLGSARALLPEAVRGEAYRSTIGNEIAEAMAFVGAEGAIVRCSNDIAPAVRDALRSMPAASVEGLNDGHGFLALGKGGRVQVDGTLEARLQRLAPALAIEIHEHLEEG